MKKTYKVETIKGTKYYKCLLCGAVGNWKKFITSRQCCIQAKKK